MTEENKKQSKLAWELVKNSKQVLLHCHQNADGDSVASALATYHALTNLGKKVTIIRGDTLIPRSYHHFPGYKNIFQGTYFDINPAEYDLFIIQDSSSKDRISRLGEVIFPSSMKTIVIDHHDTSQSYADVQIVEPSYPATAALLYELFLDWGIEITKDIALCLLLGIYEDTGGFKYENTSTETFKMAAALTAIQPKYHESILLIENSLDENQMKYMALVLNSIEHYFGGKLALGVISYEKLTQNGLTKRDTLGLEMSNRLRSVIGWDLAITMLEHEPGVVGFSLRTRDANKYDLTKIAVPLGGGGHKASSGAVVKAEFKEAQKLLLDTIKKAFPELGDP